MNTRYAHAHFSETADLRRIERSPVTLLHGLIVVLCACGFAVDLMEITLGNALSVIFSAGPYHLRGAELSWLLSSVYVGAILGAPGVGWLADRIGPRRALGLTLLWLAVSSAAAGISPTPTVLTIARLCSGLALGAYPPLMIAYLSDIAPIRRRGSLIFTTCALAYLAPPAAIMAIRSLGRAEPWGIAGWRWPYDVGSAFCLLAAVGFAYLPEAPHWLSATGRSASSAARRFLNSRALHASGGPMQDDEPLVHHTATFAGKGGWRDIPRRPWMLGATVYFLIPWVTVAFPLVAGPLLLARHVSLSDTLFYVAAATFGPVLGTFASALLADRLAFRAIMIFCTVGMLASILLFFLTRDVSFAAMAMVVMGLSSAVFMPAMTAFATDLFTADVRGKATTSLWVVNRLGAVASPLMILPMIERHLYTAALGFFCAILAGLLCALIFMVSRTQGGSRAVH